MTTTHTQGRLHVKGAQLRDDGPGIDCIATMQVSNQPFWDQDARRLVACWNACEGIPTDILQRSRIDQITEVTSPGEPDPANHGQLATFKINAITIGSLMAERDAMRALLHRVTHDSEWSCMDPDLQDDIAKALGMDKTPALPVPPLPVDIFAPPCEPMCAKDDQQPQPGGGPGYICRKCGFDLPF